jgi:lysophospholipase L1-like esterase
MDSLNPKIWFIMIGTNDLFTSKCNHHFVLASILNVAKTVSLRYPESLFVMHGIMPRKDNPKAPSNVLGKTWKQAQDINSELRKFCKKYRNFYYMQAGELMLKGSSTRGRAQLDSQMMMEDGVHPTLEGFERWGDFVSERLVDVLKDFEEFKAKLKEGK